MILEKNEITEGRKRIQQESDFLKSLLIETLQ